MSWRFHKYHGLGNDYLIIEGVGTGALGPDLVRRLCDRHHGIGSDGILLPVRSAAASVFGLRIYNPDGSEAEKSGNGLRIFARWLWDTGRVGPEPFEVETRGGRVRCEVRDRGRRVFVEMGQASFASQAIPVAGRPRDVVDEELVVDGEPLRITAVSVGNPHCVVFTSEPSRADAERLGPRIERHPSFPNRTNVQLCRVRDRHAITIEIWERGAGYTLASGSSSCAAAAAAVRLGHCASPVTVHMPGGTLEIGVGVGFELTMEGPVGHVADGVIAEELIGG